MFPRVLGRIAGQFVATACEGYNHVYRAAQSLLNNNVSDTIESGFRRGLFDAALFTLAPAPLRPLVAAYRAWSLWNHPLNSAGTPQVQSRSDANSPSSGQEKGLACYLNAMSESDPFLMSPFGTMPFENCR
jgi:hypothetical protein